jgi:membrane dipeptidase
MRIPALLGAAVCLLAGSLLFAPLSADDLAARARKIHFSSVVLDTHADTTQRLLYEKFDLGQRDTRGHLDIPRMREGGLNAEFFSIWMPSQITGPEAVKRSLRMIDAVREQVRRHPQDLVLATTAADVRRAHAQDRIAVLLGMEGGHMVDNDLGVLRTYAALGVRYLTLTHSLNDDWADSSTDKPAHNGLTDFGREVVRELNRQGVLVDISHVSDKTFYDALETSRAPLIASHSSCRAICNTPRNMTDDMIRALAQKGGVIQINYHVGFLDQAAADSADLKEYFRAVGEADRQYASDPDKKYQEYRRVEQEFESRLPKVSWEKIIEHIDHAVKLAGTDHVGLGSDFDGAKMPEGMEDCSKLPRITEALLRKGYSESDIRKILGGDLLRVMEEAERVSREMQAEEKK